jgi:hypothetical protein
MMPFDLLDKHDLLYHYEVVVTRQGRDHVLARVPSRRAAERTMVMAPARLEISRQSVQWRRVRGLHPDRIAYWCMFALLVSLALPGIWPRLIAALLCLAVIGGLQSSGRKWRRGGEDDR